MPIGQVKTTADETLSESGVKTRRKRAVTLGPNQYEEKTGGNGCVKVYVVLSRINKSDGAIQHNARKYLVSVNVTEAGTDISQTTEIIVPVRESKLFKVITSESPKFFKPGLEYYGTVRIERPDGLPVIKQRIEICYNITYYQGSSTKSSTSPPFILRNTKTATRAQKCNIYRTDSSGRVIYVVSPQSGQMSSLAFKGRTLGTKQRFVLATVRAWYSPSDSFIMIDARDLLDKGACGQIVTIGVLRSANLRKLKLQYMVLSRGDIVSDGVFGSGRVRLTLLSTMAPAFRLLVYAVTDQGEVVADSKRIRVAQCLPNKVSVTWSKVQAKPGDNASLSITASPGSLCGVDAVDRSAQLIGTSNTVSMKKVFSQVEQLLIREQALPRLTRPGSGYCPSSNRVMSSGSKTCPKDRPSSANVDDLGGGRYRIPYEETRSSYKMDDRDDSIAAFDMAGFLAVTNLALQTRPCVEDAVTVTKYRTCQDPVKIIVKEAPSKSGMSSQASKATVRTRGEVRTSVASSRRTAPRQSAMKSHGVSVTMEKTTSGVSAQSQSHGDRGIASFGSAINTGTTTSAVTLGRVGPYAIRGSGSTTQVSATSLDSGTILGKVGTRSAQAAGEANIATDTTVDSATSLDSGTILGKTGTRSAQAAGEANIATDTTLEPIVRSYFPETFIFQMEALGSSGKTTLARQLPDTITRWIGSAFCSHHKVGFGISPPSSIKVFQPFFAEINVPYSVKRGELLQLKVSVFNFLSSDLSVVLQLEEVPGVQLQSGSAGGARRALCVRADRPAVSTFPVLFTSLGRVSLIVSVRAAGTACGTANNIGVQSDALLREVLVKPEGFPQEKTYSKRICPEKGGSEKYVFDLPSSTRVVPNSARAVVSIYGDPLAPAITQLSGLKSLVQLPTGCGEQNMIKFVPNILVRQYMEAKQLLSDDLKKRTTDNMLSGYQNQLRYRHRDGAYSIWGGNGQGSLWLTVYVIRWFAAAQKYVPIDAADLAVSRRWVERQQRTDGCFNRVGRLVQKAMSGGVAGGDRLALTAFTVLALLETDANTTVVRRAVTCLRSGSPSGLYAQVMVTHALAAAGERAAAAATLPALLRLAVRDKDSLHWRSERSSKWGGGAALDVEIIAYMVLTLLRLSGHAGDVGAAVRWLDSQRNGRGGWFSTQDTVVALSALVAAEKQSSALTQRGVDVSVRSGAKFWRKFRVTANNRLLHQQAELRPLKLPTSVAVTVTGTGCVLAQTTMRYSLLETKANQSFALRHEIRPMRKGSCQSLILKVCTSYLEEDKASNMAIVEIEMLSGFLVIDDALQQLEQSGVIRNWEHRKSIWSLYFDQVESIDLCFDLRILRATVVDNLKPATIVVYDYHIPEQRAEIDFTLPDC